MYTFWIYDDFYIGSQEQWSSFRLSDLQFFTFFNKHIFSFVLNKLLLRLFIRKHLTRQFSFHYTPSSFSKGFEFWLYPKQIVSFIEFTEIPLFDKLAVWGDRLSYWKIHSINWKELVVFHNCSNPFSRKFIIFLASICLSHWLYIKKVSFTWLFHYSLL